MAFNYVPSYDDDVKQFDLDAITAVIDLDFVKYSASSVGDRRWIVVTHKASGKQVEFKGKEEFWGRKGSGGWFKRNNDKRIEKGLQPRSIDEFEIEQFSEPKDPIENILHSAKLMVEKAIKMSGADQYIAYYGKGAPDRVERSTLMEYKGNRTGTPKPTYLEQVTDYLADRFNGEVVTGIECDDKVVQVAYGKPNYFVLGVDKDYRGSGSNFFDVNSPEEGIIDTSGLGELWIKQSGKSKKVKGRGLLFKLWQVCSEDTIDNYKANCHSSVKWGAMSAYKALVDCKTEKEAYEATINVFKKLYPEPKEIETWKGDKVVIDWMYVLQELYDLAHMQRWDNDVVDLKEVFDKLGIEY